MEITHRSYTATNERSPAGREDLFLVYDEDNCQVARFTLHEGQNPMDVLAQYAQAVDMADEAGVTL